MREVSERQPEDFAFLLEFAALIVIVLTAPLWLPLAAGLFMLCLFLAVPIGMILIGLLILAA